MRLQALIDESAPVNIAQEEVKQSAPISAPITDTKMVIVPSGKPDFTVVIKG